MIIIDGDSWADSKPCSVWAVSNRQRTWLQSGTPCCTKDLLGCKRLWKKTEVLPACEAPHMEQLVHFHVRFSN